MTQANKSPGTTLSPTRSSNVAAVGCGSGNVQFQAGLYQPSCATPTPIIQRTVIIAVHKPAVRHTYAQRPFAIHLSAGYSRCVMVPRRKCKKSAFQAERSLDG